MSGDLRDERISQHFASAGEALSRARVLLLKPAPQNLDIAACALASAISQINDLRTAWIESPGIEMAAGIAGLRRELDLIAGLLEHAASYHVNLMQCMIEASGADVLPDPRPAQQQYQDA
ncbi:MAG: hypothetical protein ABI759_01665 [Candidatus Solibacter sp.]